MPASAANVAFGSVRYWLLCFGVACQLATIVISWEVWQVRPTPPNMPLLDLPQISFGWLAVASLLTALVWPRYGALAHAVVVALACVFDQYRLQPQFLAMVVLLLACVSDGGLWIGRWYLAAMWFWAGLHKLLSPEWIGSSSWWHLQQSGIVSQYWHVPFAIGVAIVELGLGIAAILRPKAAAPGCAAMHLGVLVSLSPLVRNFNPSVWPWNLASAVIGYWILRSPQPQIPSRWWWLAPAALLIMPAGFYFDVVNPHLASVLYSGNMPRAYHTSRDAVRRLDGWGKLAVPFPDSPRLLVRSFELSGEVGDKLFIQDPRPLVPDRYFLLGEDRTAQAITRERFLETRAGEVAGVEMPDPEVIWRLKQAGVELTLLDEGTTYSAAAWGDQPAAALCREVAQLANLRELKIKDAKLLPPVMMGQGHELPRLEIVEFVRCQVPGGLLVSLSQLGRLRYLHWESTPLHADSDVELSVLSQLEVLRLPLTTADDALLDSLPPMPSLTWLDLRDTKITDLGASQLLKFPACSWINLAGTQITSTGLAQLAQLQHLEVIELARTDISDEGLAPLKQLQRLEHLDLEDTPISDAAIEHLQTLQSLKQLNLRGTNVTPAAAERLARSLPSCMIAR